MTSAGALAFRFRRETGQREIVGYIGVEQLRPEIARKVARKIYRQCEQYARSPLIGERRDDLIGGIRIFPLDDGIRLARVLHGAQLSGDIP